MRRIVGWKEREGKKGWIEFQKAQSAAEEGEGDYLKSQERRRTTTDQTWWCCYMVCIYISLLLYVYTLYTMFLLFCACAIKKKKKHPLVPDAVSRTLFFINFFFFFTLQPFLALHLRIELVRVLEKVKKKKGERIIKNLNSSVKKLFENEFPFF